MTKKFLQVTKISTFLKRSLPLVIYYMFVSIQLVIHDSKCNGNISVEQKLHAAHVCKYMYAFV